MALQCMFCPAPADSKEDAFPKRLMRRFTQSGMLERQRSIDDVPMCVPTKSPFKTVVDRICQDCNNGWMSGLQNRAKPIIEQILDNPKCQFEIHECETLSLWTVMTAMVLEGRIGREAWRFSDSESSSIAQGRNQLPPFTRVWIGRWVDPTGPSYICHLLSGDGVSAVGAVTTFGFGTLAFQILKIASAGMTYVPISCRPGPWDDILLEIWPFPSQPIRWPLPMGILADMGMEALELRFSPPGARPA
jgi:hypothetical protein